MRKLAVSSLVISAIPVIWVGAAWWQGRQSPGVFSYDIVSSKGAYEVRRYQAYNAAQVQIVGPWSLALSEGARVLGAYLSGDNIVQDSVAIGAGGSSEPASAAIADAMPLIHEQKNSAWLVSAAIPANFSFDTLPRPNDPKVRIIQVPGQLVAAISVTGELSQGDAEKRASELGDLLVNDKRVILGKYKVVHYGPLWAPSFLKHHDILIPIR